MTAKNCQYLDRHLTFPLLEFLLQKDIYDQTSLLKFILQTVSKTNMVDYTMDIRERLNMGKELPEELSKRRANVLVKLKELQTEVAPLMKCMEELKNPDSMKDSKSIVHALQQEFDFKYDIIKSAQKLAKYLYECGNYRDSISYLYICLLVMEPADKNYLTVLWGKLAAEILTLNWPTALEDLTRLRDFIDNHNFSPIEVLQQRTWLIHWSVLVFFNHAKGRGRCKTPAG